MRSNNRYSNFSATVQKNLSSSWNIHRKASKNFVRKELNDFNRETVKGIISFVITLQQLITAWIPDISVVVKTSKAQVKRTSLSYSKAMCVFLTPNFVNNLIEENSFFYCALIEVKRRGKKCFSYVWIFSYGVQL